jgi:CheY-like chemotaxis protein
MLTAVDGQRATGNGQWTLVEACMDTLPRSARWLLGGVCGAAALLIWVTAPMLPVAHSPLWFAGVLIPCVLLLSTQVTLTIPGGRRIGLGLDVASAIALAAMSDAYTALLVGVSVGVVALMRRRSVAHALFSAATHSIAASLAALVYVGMQRADTLAYHGPWGMLALLAVASVHYSIITLLEGMMLAVANERPLFQGIGERGSAVFLNHALAIPFGATAAALWSLDRWFGVLTLLTLVAAQQLFRLIGAIDSERTHEQHEAEALVRWERMWSRMNDVVSIQQAGTPLLVVSADITVSGALDTALFAHGYTIHSVSDGAAGLRCLNEREFVGVLVDSRLPDMPGALFVERLYAAMPHVWTLGMAHVPGSADADAMLDAGAAAIIRIPFDNAELSAALTHLHRRDAEAADRAIVSPQRRRGRRGLEARYA